MLRETTENEAIKAVAAMQKGQVIDLNASLAMSASKLSITYKLPMADSIIIATAKKYNATLWTMDSDFKGIQGVKYFEKE